MERGKSTLLHFNHAVLVNFNLLDWSPISLRLLWLHSDKLKNAVRNVLIQHDAAYS